MFTMNLIETLKTSMHITRYIKNTELHVRIVFPKIHLSKDRHSNISILCWFLWYYYCNIYLNNIYCLGSLAGIVLTRSDLISHLANSLQHVWLFSPNLRIQSGFSSRNRHKTEQIQEIVSLLLLHSSQCHIFLFFNGVVNSLYRIVISPAFSTELGTRAGRKLVDVLQFVR